MGLSEHGGLDLSQGPQLLQLLVVLQLEQELPPTGELTPLSPLETALKVDNIRSAEL